MKILLVADGDSKYGAPHSLTQMVMALIRDYNVDITVAVPYYSEITKLLESAGGKVLCTPYEPFYQSIPYEKWKLPVKYLVKGAKYWYGRMAALRILERQINLNEFDLVHSNSSREDFGAIISQKYKIPLIWHIREFGDKDYNCYSYRKKYIEYMNKSAKKFIAVSDCVREHWIKKGLDSDKIVRVYNGVLHQKPPQGIVDTKREKRIVMLGSIQETKGQMQAVEAVHVLIKRGFEVAIDIVGDGNRKYISLLKKKAEEYKIEKYVRFSGYISDVQSILKKYDIGVVCSKSEGFGRVTAEYMMSGIPVIASNTGANKEIIRNGMDGLLYEYGNPADMADKIQYIFENSYVSWGNNAYNHAVEEFSDYVNARKIYDIYQSFGGGV